MKKITFMLLFAVFAFGTGYAQKGTKDALKEQNNYTSSKSVSVTDAMLDKKSNQSAVVFKNQQTAQVEELLARLNALGTQTGSISEYFTAAEIQVLSNHLKAANGVSKNAVTRGSDTRGGGTTAYGINNAGPNFGHFDHLNPTVFNAVSGGSGTSGFEGAGAISFDDPTLGYALDNNGILYEINVTTGAYTNLGNTGVTQINGMAFHPGNGTIYAISGSSLYTVNPAGPSLTLVGDHGIPSTFAIALGITDAGVGYTYDIDLDQLYSINLATGAATLIGSIGFDANFGQGMDWDPSTGTMYMSAFNTGVFDTEIRSVNLATGSTTLIGQLEPSVLSQVGWVSFVGEGGGGTSCDVSNPTNPAGVDNGYNIAPGSGFGVATDIVVGPDEDFTIDHVVINVLSTGISTVDINYYSDNAGLPGTIIGSQAGIVPTSANIIGTAFGWDIYEVVMDVTPFTFSGQPGTSTKYWLQPIVDTFWEVSYATVVESQVARLNGGVWALDTVNFAEAVYFYSGECTGGGGGDCAPGDITTFFGGGNQFAGNMFDVTASGGDDVLIEGFDINMDPGSGLISVYYKSGSYVGFESNAGAWTLLGSETVNSAGTNNPTPLNVGGLVIPAGETYGIYVTSTDYTSNNFAMNYTNGDNVFSDAYVTIQTGVGKGNPDFTGSTFLSRSWNGTIYYCAGEGGGGTDCSNPVVDINQDQSNTCMAFINQTGIAQSFTAESSMSAGAGFWFTGPVTGGETLVVELYDNLPNGGGVLLASGSTVAPGGDNWVDVFWTTPASTTVGSMYYLVVSGSVSACMGGTTFNSYPGGHLYANAGYGPFPDWDYTFRHYGCDGGGGGGGDCVEENLSEAFLGGYTTSMDQSQRIAADITVPADVDFVLNRITANIWVNAGGNVTACEVKIYADAGGLPDTSNVIDTQSVVPTSFDQIGTQGGFAIHEMILDISSVTLQGQAGNTTSYWIQLAVTSTGGSGFWDFDTDIMGYDSAFSSDGGTTWNPIPGNEQTYVFEGDCEPIGGGGGDCDETNARIGAITDGLNCSINTSFRAANDITVPADNNFELSEIKANIFSIGDITNVNVHYYENGTGNLPGTLLDSETGLSTTSQTWIGSAFGLDLWEIVVDVSEYTFNGQIGSTTTYWIQLELDNVGSSGAIYWETTIEGSVGYPAALFDGGWMVFDPTYDGVYVWVGNCEEIISSPEEIITGFTFYPNPADHVLYLQADKTIESVELYNVLGQKVLSQPINSNTSQIDVSGLSSGAYLMVVQSEGVLETYRVVKK